MSWVLIAILVLIVLLAATEVFARGAVVANGVELSEGDGLALRDEKQLVVSARDASELMLFDLR